MRLRIAKCHSWQPKAIGATMNVSVFCIKTGTINFSVWTWDNKVCLQDAYEALTHSSLDKDTLDRLPVELRSSFVEFNGRISEHQRHHCTIYWCDGDKVCEVVEALVKDMRQKNSALLSSAKLLKISEQVTTAYNNFTAKWAEHYVGQVVSDYANLMQKIAKDQKYMSAVINRFPAAAKVLEEFCLLETAEATEAKDATHKDMEASHAYKYGLYAKRKRVAVSHPVANEEECEEECEDE